MPMVMMSSSPDTESAVVPIAIVGIGCRLPGHISSPSELWDLLTSGKNIQSKIPNNRFNVDNWYHPNTNRSGSVYATGGYFLGEDESFRTFDPQFFGISAAEARVMDPQQKKLCECVYEAFESAGLKLDDLSGSDTGCFVGNFTADAAYDAFKDVEYVQPHQTTGVGLTILSNRINFIFNLKGPSMTLDTACSSTMYALHYACQSLRNGDCSAAIVGGTNLVIGVEQHLGSVSLGVLSPTSTCHTFDEAADGYARADAVGALLLKRLPDALQNRDPIRAVIRGTSINANGRSSGISHPSVHQQEKVIQTAYANARLSPETTGYCELHGTGTPVGDPVEVEAVGRVFGRYRSKEIPLHIGSVKTNIGHGEAASAIASIIKTALILEKASIPGSIGIRNLNPQLNLRDGALHICQSQTSWNSIDLPYRRASVNSFGYGGANAHAILDAAESYLDEMWHELSRVDSGLVTPQEEELRRTLLFTFSAHNEKSLRANIDKMSAHVRPSQAYDLAYTLSTRRSQFSTRAYGVRDYGASKCPDLKDVTPTSHTGPVPSLGFAFTGQGAQWAQMGLSLINEFPVFRHSLERLDKALSSCKLPPDWSILGALAESADTSTVHETLKSQTLCTALQIALVDLLASWNVRPMGVCGHSSGEIAASYAAHLCRAEEAILIAYYRGCAASSKQQQGAMLAIGTSLEEAAVFVEDIKYLAIACHNSPRSVTMSGTEESIDRLAASLAERGTFVRKLRTSGNAYHSWLMTTAGIEYERLLHQEFPKVSPKSPPDIEWQGACPMVSSVTGEILHGPIAPQYWQQNLMSRVRFVEAVEGLVEYVPAIDHIVELGPHATLAGPLRDIIAQNSAGASRIAYLPSLNRGSNSCHDMLDLAGKLFLKRYPVNLAAVNGFDHFDALRTPHSAMAKVLVDLPPYQWTNKEPLWHESRMVTDVKFRRSRRHDLLGSQLPGSSPSGPTWRNILRLEEVPWIEHHIIANDIIFPAAGYVALGLEAASQAFSQTSEFESVLVVEEMSITSTMLLQKGLSTEIVTESNVPNTAEARMDFHIKTVSAGRWAEHASGSICRMASHQIPRNPLVSSLSCIPVKQQGGRWGINADSYSKMWYDAMEDVGMAYGPCFTLLTDMCARARTLEASASATVSASSQVMSHESKYSIHPTVIDAAFQLIVIAVHEGRPQDFTKPFIPTSIRNLVVLQSCDEIETNEAAIRVIGERKGFRQILGHAVISDQAGKPLLYMTVEFTSLDAQLSSRKVTASAHPYNRLIWRPDFDRADKNQLLSILTTRRDNALDKHHFDKLEQVCVMILLNDWKRIPPAAELATLPFHLQKFATWVRQQGKRTMDSNHALCRLKDEDREKCIIHIVSEIGASVPEAALIAKLHDNLLEILFGRVGALEVMVQDRMLSRVYEEGFSGAGAYDKLGRALELIGYKEPRLRILEVGAGSGGATLPALKALRGNTSFPMYSEYVFTDVSTAFLSQAKEKFKEYSRMTFSLLDIEREPVTQGFETASFDIIVASNVIHATASIVETLKTCRGLLKSGGKLILIETTQIRLVTGLLVGQLPGYWLGVEDGRPDGPFIGEDDWHQRLQAAGFTGADHVLPDYAAPCNSTSVIVARNPVEETQLHARSNSLPPSEVIYLVYDETAHSLLHVVEREYESRNILTKRVQFREMGTVESRRARAIVFVELEAPALFDMKAHILEGLQQLVSIAVSTVWVSNAGYLHGAVPEKSLVMGLVKSMTIEEPSFRVATIDFDPDSFNLSRAARLVHELEMTFSTQPDTEEDYNFVEKNGVLYISRNVIDDMENSAFRSLFTTELEEAPLTVHSFINFQKVGDLQTMYFDAGLPSAIGASDVLVVADKVVVDQHVVDMFKGLRHTPHHSMECTGTIEAVGSGVTHLRAGQRVLCLTEPSSLNIGMTFAVLQHHCLLLSDFTANRMLERVASSLSTIKKVFGLRGNVVPTKVESQDQNIFGSIKLFCLAMCICKKIAKFPHHGSVLIHLPGDPLAYALAQIMLPWAESIAVVATSDAEKAALGRVGGLEIVGERYLNDKSDLLITSLPLQTAEWALDAMGSGGQVVVLRDVVPQVSKDVDSLLSKGLSVRIIAPLALLRESPSDVALHMSEVLEHLRSERLRPVPCEVSHIADFADASKGFETGLRYGTLAFSAAPGTIVPTRKRPQPLSFKSNASYILVGCLGGLGRVIAMWMISRGARDLIFLSRSGADKAEAASLVRELDEMAEHDYPDLRFSVIRGDVSREEDVERAVGSARHPIKGVMHAAMVLKESLFNAMSLEVWSQVVKPKVLGARNLHEKTKGLDLDFFVMTSTILSVVGAATQSNYAAANAYLDHFARYRHAQGMQATSISIGMVVQVGYVEEHDASSIALRRNGMYGITMEEFLTNLELACRRKNVAQVLDEYDPCCASNIITGMDPSRIVRNTSKSIWQRDARLRHFLHAMSATSAAQGEEESKKAGSPAAELEAVALLGESSVRKRLQELVTEKIASFLMIPASQIDVSSTLSMYGMDSMIGAELRAWLQKELSANVRFLVLLDQNLTFEDLSDRILESRRQEPIERVQ